MPYSLDHQIALREASFKGDIKEVKKILALPSIDINAAGAETKKTALHRAVEKKHVEIIKVLLTASASLDCRDITGRTPLELAEKIRCNEIVALLKMYQQIHHANQFAQYIYPKRIHQLSYEHSPDSLLREKFREHKTTLCYKLLAQYENQLPNGQALSSTITGLIDTLATLTLTHQLNFNIGSCGELTRAAFAYLLKNNQNDANFFLERLIITPDNRYPRENHAVLAINRPHDSYLKDLLSWKNAVLCDPFAEQDSIVFASLSSDHEFYSKFKKFDEVTVHVNAENTNNFLLNRIIKELHTKIIEQVEYCYANAIHRSLQGNYKTSKDQEPLSLAVLLRRAAFKGNQDDVNYLLNYINDIDAVSSAKTFHRTALHYAILYQHPAVVNLLIEKGASVHLPDLTGKTPYDLALESDNDEVINLLSSSVGLLRI